MVDVLPLEGVIGFSGGIMHALVLHPNDTHVIYPLGSTVVIRNVEKPSDQTLLQGHTDSVTCIALSTDGSTMASGQITNGGSLAEIILWDLTGLSEGKAPELLHRLRLHKVMVQALSFSYNGKYLASVGGVDDNNLVIWNVADGKAICGSPAAHDTALTVTWLNQSDLGLVTGGIKALRMWSLNPEARKVRPMDIDTMKEIRTMLWTGNEKDAVRILRVLKEIMEKPEVECEGWPVCLVINDAVKSSSDYMLIPDSTAERNLFAGAVFITVPGTLRIALRNQSDIIEKQIVRPLRMMASDWDKTADNIGLSEKEAKKLDKELARLQENT